MLAMKNLTLIVLMTSLLYAMLGTTYAVINPLGVTLDHWLTILGAFAIGVGCLVAITR